MSELEVLRAGPLTTVQDLGRPGWAHLGVPRSGALDAPAAALGHRLVGNPADAAGLEVTLGGLAVRTDGGRWVAVTGALGPVAIDDRAVGWGEPVWLPTGAVLRVGTPTAGVRSHLAIAGGVAVPRVLGSRSTDVLAGVGPPVVHDGDRLPLGPAGAPPGPASAVPPVGSGPLRLHPGPRADRLADPLATLCTAAYTVQAASNRVGLRLAGPAVRRVRDDELPSEGLVLGAVQVPPDGQPIVFLADHPTTGGYPVAAVVDPADLWRCAQLRPGAEIRFTRAT